MRPSSQAIEVLRYLRDLGFTDLLRPGAPAAPKPVESRVERDSLAVSAPQATRAEDGSLASVAAEAAVCRACRLCETRKKVVFGSGSESARLMFIGEGPGAEEDKQGLPFVGPAGELLTKIIQAIDLRREDVYIANIVKCRPPENRDPEPDEVAACRGFLERQVAIIRPDLLVALGRVAAQSLLGNETPIGRLRGRWYTFAGVPMMVTYHPAALLRNAAYKRPTWEDMRQVRDRLRALPPR